MSKKIERNPYFWWPAPWSKVTGRALFKGCCHDACRFRVHSILLVSFWQSDMWRQSKKHSVSFLEPLGNAANKEGFCRTWIKRPTLHVATMDGIFHVGCSALFQQSPISLFQCRKSSKQMCTKSDHHWAFPLVPFLSPSFCIWRTR